MWSSNTHLLRHLRSLVLVGDAFKLFKVLSGGLKKRGQERRKLGEMVPRLERMWRVETTRGRTKRAQFGWCFQQLSWWTVGLSGSPSRQLLQFSVSQKETRSLGSSVTSTPALLCLHTEQSFRTGNRISKRWQDRLCPSGTGHGQISALTSSLLTHCPLIPLFYHAFSCTNHLGPFFLFL